MAQSKPRRIGLWIILSLLFLGLVGFGGSGLRGTARTIGTVGDRDLTIAEYQLGLNNLARTLSAQTGNLVTVQQIVSTGLDQQYRNGLVTDRAIDVELAEMGISIGDDRVRDIILNDPNFVGFDGEFDRETYRELLQRQGLSEANYEQILRDTNARAMMQEAISGGVTLSQPMMDRLLTFQAERRDLTVASIDASSLETPIAEPDIAALETFHSENPDLFTTAETRAISYAWLTPSMLQDAIEIDEAQLQTLYDERIEDYVRPERRLVERMIFSTEDAAQDASDRIIAGEIDFDGLAQERGLDLGLLDLGDVTIADLGAAGEAVFALENGTVSGPLPAELGPALYRVNLVLAAEEVTLEEAAPDLREELANAKARRAIDDQREMLADMIAGGARIEDLAERTEMTLGTISWTEDTEGGIAAYDEFRDAARAAVSGAFPEILELSDGGIFALRLDGVTAPELAAFDTVEDDVRTAWIAQETQQAVIERGAALAEQLAEGAEFEALGLEPQFENDLTRRGFVAGMPLEFQERAFADPIGSAGVIETDSGAVVYRVEDIRPPDLDDADVAALAQVMEAQIGTAIGADLFDAYRNTVRDKADISINDAVIAQINAQLQ